MNGPLLKILESELKFLFFFPQESLFSRLSKTMYMCVHTKNKKTLLYYVRNFFKIHNQNNLIRLAKLVPIPLQGSQRDFFPPGLKMSIFLNPLKFGIYTEEFPICLLPFKIKNTNKPFSIYPIMITQNPDQTILDSAFEVLFKQCDFLIREISTSKVK